MQTIALTPSVTTTRLGFGCASLMREPARRRRERLLATAFEEGVRHFDVARMYGLGAAEGELGRFARGRREDVVIATKFGIEAGSTPGRLAALQGPARRLLARYPALRDYVKRRSDTLHTPHRYDAATARASLERSLRELQTDYVDILFLHGPSPGDTVDLPEMCAYLDEARQAGQIRAWGVAGEHETCVQIGGSLPAPAILQAQDDIFHRGSRPLEKLAPLITFGILSSALERILAHLSSSSERRARWSQALGADCASTDTLASLLLRDALQANSEGVVLFSTTRPERLQRVNSLLAPHAADDSSLAAFRDLVSEEMAFSQPVGRRDSAS